MVTRGCRWTAVELGLGVICLLNNKVWRKWDTCIFFLSGSGWHKGAWPCYSHSPATTLLIHQTVCCVPSAQTDTAWKCPLSECCCFSQKTHMAWEPLHAWSQPEGPSTACSFERSWKVTHLGSRVEMTKGLSWILFAQPQGMADHIGIHFPVYAEGNGVKTETNTFF